MVILGLRQKMGACMTWREERRLLNRCLAKIAPKTRTAKHITGQVSRNLRRKRKIQSVLRWRRRHPKKYRQILRLQRQTRRESFKQKQRMGARLTQVSLRKLTELAKALCQQTP